MRCSNCGYINEDGVERCIKCNAVLHKAQVEEKQNVVFNPAQTVNEMTVDNSEKTSMPARKRPRPEPIHATQRRRQNINGSNDTPQKTINPWQTINNEHQCWLKMIEPETPYDEKNTDNHIVCNADEFMLGRENTNPKDQTISAIQAVLIRDENGWWIEDRSTYKSTSIVVTHKTKLAEGDIIALGTSRFLFTEKDPQKD